MSNPIELVADSPAAKAVPTPWHRTVYITGETKESPFGLFARRFGDIALGVQTEALNTSIQLFTKGVKIAADATKSAASTIPSQIPGAALVADVAERVGNRALKVAQDAGAIARQEAPGAAAGKLAADMILGPATDLAAFPVTTALDVAEAAAATPAGQTTGASVAQLLNAVLDLFSVSGASTTLDTFRLRESWLAMTTGPGKTALSDIFNIASGFFRVQLGDFQSLGNALETGIISMNYGYQYGQNGFAYPQIPIGIVLGDIAGLVLRYQPATLISALGTNDPWKVANATLEDCEAIFATSFLYPTGLVLVALNIFRFLAIGLRDVNDVETYVKLEEALAAKYPDLTNEAALDRLSALSDDDAMKDPAVYALDQFWRERPFTSTEFEFYVGEAKSPTDPDGVARGILNHSILPVGVFPQELIDLAQDTAFWYSSTVLGRDAALVRMCRVYGSKVRDRLAADPSLETDAGLDAARAQALVDNQKGGAKGLQKLKSLADEKVEAFRKLEANPDIYMPSHTRQRMNFFIEVQKRAAAALAHTAARVPTTRSA